MVQKKLITEKKVSDSDLNFLLLIFVKQLSSAPKGRIASKKVENVTPRYVALKFSYSFSIHVFEREACTSMIFLYQHHHPFTPHVILFDIASRPQVGESMCMILLSPFGKCYLCIAFLDHYFAKPSISPFWLMDYPIYSEVIVGSGHAP